MRRGPSGVCGTEGWASNIMSKQARRPPMLGRVGRTATATPDEEGDGCRVTWQVPAPSLGQRKLRRVGMGGRQGLFRDKHGRTPSLSDQPQEDAPNPRKIMVGVSKGSRVTPRPHPFQLQATGGTQKTTTGVVRSKPTAYAPPHKQRSQKPPH